MSLLLLHLSDLHISDRTRLKSAEKVIAAVAAACEGVEAAAVLISGDIAWSGQPDEYKLATAYVAELTELLRNAFKVDVWLTLVPGNHDCLFPEDSAVRDVVIEKICGAIGSLDSQQMLRECVKVQDGFFGWTAGLTKCPELDDPRRLCWTENFDLPNRRKLAILCLNTAWMSSKDEKQGNLVFPIDRIPSIQEADLVVSVFHHPYNWFQYANGRKLRGLLQASCDVIITGHEHDANSYSVRQKRTGAVEYVEGHLFGNPKSETDCGFNLVLADLNSSLYQVRNYRWNGKRFSTEDSGDDWTPFIRNTRRGSYPPELSEEWSAFLRDPGASFTHHAKDVELEDIFVAPNLERLVLTARAEELRFQIVESDNSINRVFEEKHVYFSGDSQCGKTSLAKALFEDAFRRNLSPVWLNGALLNRSEPRRLVNTLKDQIPRLYRNLSSDEFLQLSKEQRVVIVDDFCASPLNRTAKTKVLQWLREKYGYVFVFGGDLTQLEEFVMDKERVKALAGYGYYKIMEFGHLLREKLTEKWLMIGRADFVDSDELAHDINQAGNLVNTVFGKNLMPSYPIFVLSLLQGYEVRQPVDTRSGAYGYFYEVLITAALHRTSRSVFDIDMKYTYLAELAWHIFTKHRKHGYLDTEELERFNEKHWSEYRLVESSEHVASELTASRILRIHGSRAQFAYRYIYYYFVARHIRDNVSEEHVQKTLNALVENLQREDCANIVIFLTYLSKDKAVIGKVLGAARKFLQENEPCDMETDIEFLNRLQERMPEIVLPGGDANEHRKDMLRRQDLAEIAAKEITKDIPESDSDDDDEFEEFVGLNRALKSVQIMGQILRNFCGSLSGDIKQELAKECFCTGLRALNFVLHALERNLEDIVTIFGEVLGTSLEGVSDEEKGKRARSLIFSLVTVLSFAMFKRISSAVGSERLIPTLEDLRADYDNKGTEFVQIAIRLDHCRHFPEKRIMEFKRSVEEDVFGMTLLRLLVAEHFYLFPRSARTRQSVCDRLGIAWTQKTLLLDTMRKRPT